MVILCASNQQSDAGNLGSGEDKEVNVRAALSASGKAKTLLQNPWVLSSEIVRVPKTLALISGWIL